MLLSHFPHFSWRSSLQPSGGTMGDTPPNSHHGRISTQSPTKVPVTCAKDKIDINAILVPRYAEPSARCDRVNPREIWTTCPHCQCTDDFCYLNLYNGQYSVYCEDLLMNSCNFVGDRNYQCRQLLYVFMFHLVLTPLQPGQSKALPECIVRDIQETFPFVAGECGSSNIEDEIEFYRNPEEPGRVFLALIPRQNWTYKG